MHKVEVYNSSSRGREGGPRCGTRYTRERRETGFESRWCLGRYHAKNACSKALDANMLLSSVRIDTAAPLRRCSYLLGVCSLYIYNKDHDMC